MNRFYQHPLSPAWRTARSRAALVEPSSRSRRYVAMTLHRAVIYGSAIEASQAFAVVGCFSFSRHDAAFTGTIKGSRKEALSRRPWRHHWVQ